MSTRFRAPFALIAVAFPLAVCSGQICRAANGQLPAQRPSESPLQRARRLRKARKFERALAVLKQIQPRKDLSKDTAGQVLLERALTYRGWAYAAKDRRAQLRRFDAALTAVGEFLKRFPKHARTGEGLSMQGRMLLSKGRAGISTADAATDGKKRKRLQKLAEKDIVSARAAFKRAYEIHEARRKKFPLFIPAGDREQRVGRQRAEVDVIQDQLDLASTIYWEAQSPPGGKAARKELLEKAARQYGQIHSRYRTQIGGLLARLWQAKCLQEQGDIPGALRIYNEFLEQPHQSVAMKRLQNQALHFKLICLNHKLRKDYQLAIDYANEWLKNNKPLHGTSTGFGIRWQLAVAQEQMTKKAGMPAKSRDEYKRDALANARLVSRRSSKYRLVAIGLIKRLGGLPNSKPGNFADAYSLAMVQYSTVKTKSRRLEQAKEAGKPRDVIAKLEAESKSAVETSAAAFRLALKLADAKTDASQRNQCRFMLAFLEYTRKQDAEARKLAMQVARAVRKSQPRQSRDAAYLALAAAVRQHNSARGEKRASLRKTVETIAQFLIKNWPDNERAKRARQILSNLKQDR